MLTGGLGEMRGVDAPFSEHEAAQADAICDENQEGSEYTYLPKPWEAATAAGCAAKGHPAGRNWLTAARPAHNRGGVRRVG